MVNWRNALKEIGGTALTTTGDLLTPGMHVIPGSRRFDPGNDVYDKILQDAGKVIWGGSKDVAHELVDNPYIKQAIGSADYQYNRLDPIAGQPYDPVSLLTGSPAVTLYHLFKGGNASSFLGSASKEDVLKAHEQGGGRAVWETQQGTNPAPIRAFNDIASDPLTYVGLEGTGKAGESLAEAGKIQAAKDGLLNKIVGHSKLAVGKDVKLAHDINDIPAKGLNYVSANILGGLAKTQPGQWISQPSKREAARKAFDTGEQWIRLSGIINNGMRSDVGNQVEGFNRAQSDLAYLAPNASGGVKVWTDAKVEADFKAKGYTGYTKQEVTDERIRRNKMISAKGRATPALTTEDQAKKITNILYGKAGAKVTQGGVFGVGDRVFERGTYAGKDIPFMAHDVQSITRAELADLQRMNMAFTTQPSKSVLKNRLSKLNAADTQRIENIFKKYEGTPLNPILATERDMVLHNITNALKEDPTIAGLSDEANAWLFDNKLKSVLPGKNYADALVEWAKKARQDKQLLINLVGQGAWARDAKREYVEGVLKDHGPELKAYRYWKQYGVDILNEPIDNAAISRLKAAYYNDHGIFRPSSGNTWTSDMAKIWRGISLVSPRYHESNITSSWFNNALTNGLEGMASPQDFSSEIKHAVKADPNLISSFGTKHLNDTLEEHGIYSAHPNIARSGMSSLASDTPAAFERMARRLHMGDALAGKIGKGVEYNRRFGAGIDAAGRGNLWDSRFTAGVEAFMPQMEDEVRRAAMKQGIDMQGLSLVPFRDPSTLEGYYRGLGFSDGMSRHLTNFYANKQQQAMDDALKLVQKTHFSYYRTPADELLSRVMPFHYYASRSTKLYAETMMQNPVLLVNFARLADELYGNYDNAGLNARQKGWLYVATGPAGFTMLANPDALFGFTRALGLMGDNYKSDQTQLGGILQFLQDGGYGMYPIYNSLFDLAGTYGSSYDTDVLGIRHKALIGSIIQSLMAETGRGGTNVAPYAGINDELRQFASEHVSKFLPGWMSQPVPVRNNASGTVAQASLDGLIESRIISTHPGITNDQLFQMMNDTESPEYRQAWQDVARSGVANQLMSFLLPTSLKFKDSANDVRSAKLTATYDAAKRLGIPADAVSASQDAKFAADYKAMTGGDWKPGDFAKAQFETDMKNATPIGRSFVYQDYQYKALGAPGAKDILSQYYKYKYGDEVPPGYQRPPDVVGQDNSKIYQQMADNWLSRQPASQQAAVNDLLSLQSAFKTAHPDYAAYKDWQGKMGTLKDVLGGSLALYREQVSRANPNANRYFQALMKSASKIKDVQKRKDFLDIGTTSADAWLAVNGLPQRMRDASALPTATSQAPAYLGTDQMLAQYDQSYGKPQNTQSDYQKMFG